MIKTRVVRRPDGGYEVIRVLDNQVLNGWRRENPLAFEKSIVWLQPIETLDFVRVAEVRNARSRRGPLACSGNHIVLGYSKLTSDAPVDPLTKGYSRRLFYLKEEDFQLNMNEFPASAIDPLTILPGASGRPPSLAEAERGYPWWQCRSTPPAEPPAVEPPVASHDERTARLTGTSG